MIFSPGIYEHAAAFLKRSPWDVSRDGRLLMEAHRAAWEYYQHPVVVCGIDVYNLEPEAYGARIQEPSGTHIPSIASHPCMEIEDLCQLPAFNPARDGRIPEVIHAGQLLHEQLGQSVYIPVCGPFALGIGLLGLDDLLVAVIEEPDVLRTALAHLLYGQKAYLTAIHEAGLKPIIFESGTTPPLLPATAFRVIEAPLLKELFDHCRLLSGESPACVIGGDAAPIAGTLLNAGPGWVIAPSETDQSAFMDAAMAFPDIHVRVNVPASILLQSDPDAIQTEAERARTLALKRPNTSIGCGVVPFETDPESVLHLKSLIENPCPSSLNPRPINP